MRNGLVISSTLHFGVILATVYGLPQIWDPLEVREQQIVVELVTVAERTTLQNKQKKDDKKDLPPAPEVKKITKPKLAPEREKTPPPPKKLAKLPPPPALKPTKAEPVRKKPPEPKPEEIAKQKPITPKLPKEKPKPTKLIAHSELSNKFLNLPRPRWKPERTRLKFNAERIAALLDQDEEKKPQKRHKKTNWKKTVKELTSKIAPAPERLRIAPMTMSEIDAIRYQMQQCWILPAGAKNAEILIPRIRVFLNADGSLSKPPEIVATKEQLKNPFYVTAAESARRAVLKCAPLKNLPVEKFASWSKITLTFDPRAMLGSAR